MMKEKRVADFRDEDECPLVSASITTFKTPLNIGKSRSKQDSFEIKPYSAGNDTILKSGSDLVSPGSDPSHQITSSLALSLDLFTASLQLLPVIAFVMSEDCDLVVANGLFHKHFPHLESTHAGTDPFWYSTIMHEDDAKKFTSSFQRYRPPSTCALPEFSFESRFVVASSAIGGCGCVSKEKDSVMLTRWFMVNCKQTFALGGNHWVVTLTDIDKDRSDSYSKCDLFQTVLDLLPLGVIVAEAPSGKFIFCNDSVFRNYNMSPADIPGNKSWQEYAEWPAFHADGSRYKAQDWPLCRSLLYGEVVVEEETIVQLGDGAMGLFRISSQPIRNEHGEISLAVVIFENITEKKAIQEERNELLAREKAARSFKSEFLSNMSHEIRTPLTGILGTAELLLTDPTNSQEGIRSGLNTIRSMGHSLHRIINNILDLSYVESDSLSLNESNVQILHILDDIASAFQMKAKSRNVSLQFEIDSETVPHTAFCDGARVRQILMNIISNSIKFTNSGGKVSVSVRADNQNAHYHRFIAKISDSGIGMSDLTMSTLFKPFMIADYTNTKKFGGTGLGLYLAKKLVDMMNGKLEVSSRLGEGTTIDLQIDFKRCNSLSLESLSTCSSISQSICSSSCHSDIPSLSQTPEPPVLPSVIREKRVLVVDDNLTIQTLVKKMLQRIGIGSILIAENGNVALDIFKTHEVDLVFMDCQMPLLDGFEATRMIRSIESQACQISKRTPIIALTASSLLTDRQECLKCGMDDHLSKPFSQQDLADKLKLWIC